jgi:hypothetical protein
MGPRALAAGLVALLALRYGYDLADGHVNDVGYASVYGADSILNGLPLYDSAPGSGNLDTYGPVSYLFYVPFDVLFPLKGLAHAHAGAARAAAISFDAATVAGLVLLGRRLRPGADGRTLGLALGWAFAAYPWTLFVLSENTNDGLVAMLLVFVLLAASSPLLRGVLMGLAAATKFAPLIVGGVFTRTGRERGLRPAVLYAVALTATIALVVFAYLPGGGLREFYDATIGFQLSRSSPFSIWGLHPAWDPLRTPVSVAVAAMAAASLWLPRERDTVRLAAAGAALLFAVQLTAKHWFYFYLPWALPYALVALFSLSYASRVRNSGSSSPSAAASNSS